MSHHDQFVAALQAARAQAGGPVSLPALLRLAMPTIKALRANGVGWKWLGARIQAVHEASEEPISADLPDLGPKRVHYLVAEFSRQKRLAQKAMIGGALEPVALSPREPLPHQTAPPQTDKRPPATSARASIHAAADLNTSFRKFQS